MRRSGVAWGVLLVEDLMEGGRDGCGPCLMDGGVDGVWIETVITDVIVDGRMSLGCEVG